jgi:hypothetical protein
VATKLLYASHYFWTALDLRLLVPDPRRGQGFWLVSQSRSRADGLTGFTGWFARRRVRSGAREGTLRILRATKGRLEGRATRDAAEQASVPAASHASGICSLP